jgi:hypothetical protein
MFLPPTVCVIPTGDMGVTSDAPGQKEALRIAEPQAPRAHGGDTIVKCTPSAAGTSGTVATSSPRCVCGTLLVQCVACPRWQWNLTTASSTPTLARSDVLPPAQLVQRVKHAARPPLWPLHRKLYQSLRRTLLRAGAAQLRAALPVMPLRQRQWACCPRHPHPRTRRRTGAAAAPHR